MKHLTLKRLDGTVVLVPRGQLVGGEETAELQMTIQYLAAEGNMCLVLNLGETEFVNSWALGVIIGAHVSYAKRGASMRLCNVSHRTSQVLVVTQLDRVFNIFGSEEKAVASPLSP